MATLPQFAVNLNKVERPPYYRRPRSRPIGFEKPNTIRLYSPISYQVETIIPNCSGVHVYISRDRCSLKTTEVAEQARKIIDSSQSNQGKPVEQSIRQCHTMMNSLPDYNSLPKPFGRAPSNSGSNNFQQTSYSRSQSAHGDFNQAQAPKILINDQATHAVYPTSTVHKSMLKSQSPVEAARGPGSMTPSVAYSRLISPTVMTASYDTLPLTVSRSTLQDSESQDAQQYQQQQQMHKTSNQLGQVDASQSSLSCSPTITQTSSPRDGSKLAASEFLQANLPHQRPDQSALISDLASLQNRMQLNSSSSYSNSVLPDTKRDEYMWNRQLERVSIAHQTYRTLPIVLPKPKARHDLASGTYMQHNYDPTWNLVSPSQLSRPSSVNRNKEHEKKIRQAIGASSGPAAAAAAATTLQGSVTGHNSSLGRESGKLVSTNVPVYGQPSSGFANQMPVENVRESMAFNYREYIESTRRAN